VKTTLTALAQALALLGGLAPAAVPEPPALALLGAGLAGLAAAKAPGGPRRKQRA
jgi:hypothetical protein